MIKTQLILISLRPRGAAGALCSASAARVCASSQIGETSGSAAPCLDFLTDFSASAASVGIRVGLLAIKRSWFLARA
jgi:hypothetical protein